MEVCDSHLGKTLTLRWNFSLVSLSGLFRRNPLMVWKRGVRIPVQLTQEDREKNYYPSM
jgi:hypothetical protein